MGSVTYKLSDRTPGSRSFLDSVISETVESSVSDRTPGSKSVVESLSPDQGINPDLRLDQIESSVIDFGAQLLAMTYFIGIRHIPIKKQGQEIEIPILTVDEIAQDFSLVTKLEKVQMPTMVKNVQTLGMRFVSSRSGRTLPRITSEQQMILFSLGESQYIVFGVHDGTILRI